MCELSTVLAAHDGSGYVVAPAGYGKTHLIAESTARSVVRRRILTPLDSTKAIVYGADRRPTYAPININIEWKTMNGEGGPD